ncbi:MAG: DUF1232 domain-containing protein [Firmicutes bacterium]|nr:DUF1232 domain-containing protein [Bacillota bacterium]
MQFLGFRVLFKRIKAIRFMMADKSVRWTKKAIIVAGIAYLFLPIDLIPPVLFPFGILDDIVVWALILWYLRSELDKYWIGEKPKDYSRKFRGKNVVDDVEYDVDDGEQETETEKEKAEENA